MGELCLGTYLQVLYNARIEGKRITKCFFVGEVLSLVTNEFDPGNTAMSKLFTGINNPTESVITKVSQLPENDYYKIVEEFRRIIMPMLNPNKLLNAIKMLEIAIVEDNGIEHDTIVDLVTKMRKKDLTGQVVDPVSFLTGVFLFVVKYTRNPGKSGVIGPIIKQLEELSAEYIFKTNDEKSTNRNKINSENERYAELTEQKAVSFCIKYDGRKNYIPLCQIAQITNPTRKHCRKMFNDFCRCTRSVQNKILEMNDVKKVFFTEKDGWWLEYLDAFEKDYREYRLGDERYLYSFGQYFPRLLNYGAASIKDFSQRFIPLRVKNDTIQEICPNHKHSIIYFIDEYMYYSKEEEYKDKLEPPMNYLWRELNFGGCSELALTSALALFIIGTCRCVPQRKPSDTPMFIYSSPSTDDLETAEDLFYATLLILYETYSLD